MSFFKTPVTIDISSGEDSSNSEIEHLEETTSDLQNREGDSEAGVDNDAPETYVFKMEKYQRLRLNKHLATELGVEPKLQIVIVDKSGEDWPMDLARHITAYGPSLITTVVKCSVRDCCWAPQLLLGAARGYCWLQPARLVQGAACTTAVVRILRNCWCAQLII